jgi:hypothetical protein
MASEAANPSVKASSVPFFPSFRVFLSFGGVAEGGRRSELKAPTQMMAMALAVMRADMYMKPRLLYRVTSHDCDKGDAVTS